MIKRVSTLAVVLAVVFAAHSLLLAWVPQVQSGPVTIFKRRKPEESLIPTTPSLNRLHDFIRMLDGEGYPPAFIEHGGYRYEFSQAALYDGRIQADVKITPIDQRAT